MKKMILLAMVSLFLVSGCTVKTTYVKSIKVVKDADGKIIQTEITEAVSQANQQAYPVKFEYLKSVVPVPFGVGKEEDVIK